MPMTMSREPERLIANAEIDSKRSKAIHFIFINAVRLL